MNLLELNDAELSLYQDGVPVYRQPAVAHVGAQRCLFGQEALRIARLHPQQANQHYLTRLNADPLPLPGARAANHADLVYLHLLELKACLGESNTAGLVAAVPGSLGTDQLGVLLGIAQEAGIDVRGFVDSAVLMGSAAPIPERCWLLDIHLTRACLTELRANTEVVSVGTEDLAGCGLLACLDDWANLLADRFLQDTRFDPLHAAATEQQLYDQLYDWIRSDHQPDASDSDFPAEVRHDGHERRVRVPRSALRRKLMRRFQQLAQKLPDNAALLLAPRSAVLPELANGLAELGMQTQSLAEDAPQIGFAHHAGRISAGPLTLVKRLPCPAAVSATPPSARPGATHVLFEDCAWPLRDNPFGIDPLGASGEVVEKDGKRLRLIRVQAGSETG